MSTVELYDQQILLGDPSGRPGDCLRAAVATMMQEPPEAVPHFAEADDWMEAVLDWRGGLLQVRYGRDGQPATFPVEEPSARCWVVGCGASPREGSHAVVMSALTGVLVHDPHPSRAGIVGHPAYVIVAAR